MHNHIQTLLKELPFKVELTCLSTHGESWELLEKKGKLHLKGESERALIYALAHLKKIPSDEVHCYFGKHIPPYPIRALCTPVAPLKALEMGFNTYVGDFAPNPFLKVIPLYQATSHLNRSRHELLKDLLVKELKEVEQKYKEVVFHIADGKGLTELNFEATSAYLSFEGETPWLELKKALPFGTPLLAYVKGSDLANTLPRMEKRHPFKGFIVETPSPEESYFLATMQTAW